LQGGQGGKARRQAEALRISGVKPENILAGIAFEPLTLDRYDLQ
jgi:hypothetical protein